MPCHYKEVEILLIKLEQYLKEQQFWSSVKPSALAMQSQAPFAVDAMPFEHWLQFIFIPKITHLIRSKSILPNNVVLLPMAEMTLCKNGKHSGLISIIKQMDDTFAHSI